VIPAVLEARLHGGGDVTHEAVHGGLNKHMLNTKHIGNEQWIFKANQSSVVSLPRFI